MSSQDSITINTVKIIFNTDTFPLDFTYYVSGGGFVRETSIEPMN